MSANDEVTITVRRKALDCAVVALRQVGATSSAAAIKDALPAPEWEPTEEQIATYCDLYSVSISGNSVWAAAQLKKLHGVGLVSS